MHNNITDRDDIEIIECEQGTAEWFAARAGVCSASMFGVVLAKVGLLDEKQQMYVDAIRAGNDEKAAMLIAGYKAPPKSTTVAKALRGEKIGEWSDAALNYAFRLACERVAGEPLVEQFETYAMRRGKELEEACRIRHEIDINEVVDLAGFIRTKDGRFGASADALVGKSGGGEYKCFYAPDKTRPIILENDFGDIKPQVQGCIWLYGAEWWDSCLYFPALKSVGKEYTRQRSLRDDAFIDNMETELLAFDALVCEYEVQIRAPRIIIT